MLGNLITDRAQRSTVWKDLSQSPTWCIYPTIASLRQKDFSWYNIFWCLQRIVINGLSDSDIFHVQLYDNKLRFNPWMTRGGTQPRIRIENTTKSKTINTIKYEHFTLLLNINSKLGDNFGLQCEYNKNILKDVPKSSCVCTLRRPTNGMKLPTSSNTISKVSHGLYFLAPSTGFRYSSDCSGFFGLASKMGICIDEQRYSSFYFDRTKIETNVFQLKKKQTISWKNAKEEKSVDIVQKKTRFNNSKETLKIILCLNYAWDWFGHKIRVNNLNLFWSKSL